MARNSAIPVARVEAPRAPCSWPGCTSRAHLRAEIEPGKGIHNLCEFHYVEASHKASARRVRDEIGLSSVEEMKEFCRRRLSSVFRSVQRGKEVVRREPGQDDEESEFANSERRVSNAK